MGLVKEFSGLWEERTLHIGGRMGDFLNACRRYPVRLLSLNNLNATPFISTYFFVMPSGQFPKRELKMPHEGDCVK